MGKIGYHSFQTHFSHRILLGHAFLKKSFNLTKSLYHSATKCASIFGKIKRPLYRVAGIEVLKQNFFCGLRYCRHCCDYNSHYNDNGRGAGCSAIPIMMRTRSLRVAASNFYSSFATGNITRVPLQQATNEGSPLTEL